MKRVLWTHSMLHLLVDGICAATIFGACAHSAELGMLVVLYNTLAFSTQCLVGCIIDLYPYYRMSTIASVGLVILGYYLPLPSVIRMILVGMGNSIFHVSAGAKTLEDAQGKLTPLGIFVSFGAIGLASATCYPQIGTGLTILAVLLCIYLYQIPYGDHQQPTKKDTPTVEHVEWYVVLLLIAVALRAFGGSIVTNSWKTSSFHIILLSCVVCLGKIAGGIFTDRWSIKKVTLCTVIPGALLLAFGQSSMPLSLVAQFLLNITMPITLALLYEYLPNNPGFAFGLAASVLWPGTKLGNILRTSIGGQGVMVVGCFIFQLFAILYCARRKGEKS